LTIAAARPRDQKLALDRILLSCQREGLASKAQYQYARGGTDIIGPTIDLMEVIAQQWGNLEFGFRELARFQGVGGQPGESVVEAYAWDLESNTRRRTQFTVIHAERTKRGMKVFSDPRDIYEWVANQAQRRVRTCLENLIPRDVVERACEQCDATLKAKVDVTPETIAKLVAGFVKFGVTKEAIESRIQRRLDAISPAQVIGLRKIYASMRDGMATPDEYFTVQAVDAKPQSAIDAAKEAMKKNRPSSSNHSDDPPFSPPTPAEVAAAEAAEQVEQTQASDSPAEAFDADTRAMEAAALESDYGEVIRQARTLKDLSDTWAKVVGDGHLDADARSRLAKVYNATKAEFGGKPKSQRQAFDNESGG